MGFGGAHCAGRSGSLSRRNETTGEAPAGAWRWAAPAFMDSAKARRLVRNARGGLVGGLRVPHRGAESFKPVPPGASGRVFFQNRGSPDQAINLKWASWSGPGHPRGGPSPQEWGAPGATFLGAPGASSRGESWVVAAFPPGVGPHPSKRRSRPFGASSSGANVLRNLFAAQSLLKRGGDPPRPPPSASRLAICWLKSADRGFNISARRVRDPRRNEGEGVELTQKAV